MIGNAAVRSSDDDGFRFLLAIAVLEILEQTMPRKAPSRKERLAGPKTESGRCSTRGRFVTLWDTRC